MRGTWVAALLAALVLLLGEPPASAATAVDEARRLLRRGHYEQVVKRAGPAARRSSRGAELAVLGARAEAHLGRLRDARLRLEVASVAAPEDLRVRGELLKVLSALGDERALRDLVDRTRRARIRANDAGGRTATELVALALAARFGERWDEANETFREAVKADPGGVEANLEWGALFLEKHAADNAATSFREVLALDPHNPDAHIGMARAALEQGYDEAAAARAAAAALAINPRHPGALTLRGEIALDADDFPTVDAAIAALRRTNPDDAGAAWLAAGRALLAEDRAGYEAERDRLLAARPRDGELFAQVAEALVRHRRYDEARAVAEEGARHAPRHARLLASLGNTLLRLGDEGAGLETLRRAWERDPYNLRTYNLLNLFEKVIPTSYTLYETKHLRFRVEPAALPVIEAVVAPFLEATYERYAERYGFEPAGPIVFELYGRPEHYAVRTVGLPRLGVAGVCFGRVITSQAPTNAAFNWGMVLAHELAHVFALQLSRSRAPRWLAEGLAELDALKVRPEWRRNDDLELFAALRTGTLEPIGQLSQAFVRARDLESASLAYMHAAVAVEWLEARFGFVKLREALVALGRGQRGPAILEALSGMSAAALDREFRVELERRLGVFDKQFLPETLARWRRRPDGLGADGRQEGLPRGAPPAALAERGLLLLERGDLTGAARLSEAARAAKGGARDPSGRYLAAVVALMGGRTAEAATGLDALIAEGHDGYDLRIRRALTAVRLRDGDAVERHLRRAVELAPRRVEPRALLAERLRASGAAEARLTELAGILPLDPQEADLAKEVTLEGARLRRPDLVAEAGAIATFIDPADADLHAATGRALMALGRTSEAIAAFERALRLTPADPSSLHRDVAALYERIGAADKAGAHRRAAEKRLSTIDGSAPPSSGRRITRSRTPAPLPPNRAVPRPPPPGP